MLAGLRLAKELEVKSLQVFIDSHLIAGQVTNEYEAGDLTMARYLDKF